MGHEIREWLRDAQNFLCECGARPFEGGMGNWRWNGRCWEHYHGYSIGYVPTKYNPKGGMSKMKHKKSIMGPGLTEMELRKAENGLFIQLSPSGLLLTSRRRVVENMEEAISFISEVLHEWYSIKEERE